MQRTRFNTLLELFGERLQTFFSNPWRKISLILISLLLGFFVGGSIATTVGQAAQWDVTMAASLLIFTEIISRFVYSRRPQKRRLLFFEVLNIFKIGLVYSLYLEAFKLGS